MTVARTTHQMRVDIVYKNEIKRAKTEKMRSELRAEPNDASF